ncbi:MAG: ABC transporter permease [Saprospiraceae bacterium]|nr:ABC transporter permease [Saprospiraceae bacterium]
MLINYLNIAVRQLLRHKRFSALNIFGMAAGMSVCMLVIMAVRDQYGYDDFHANGERIYRIISAEADKNQPLQKATHATAPLSLLEVIQDHSPYMEAGARLVSMGDDFKIGERVFPNELGGYAVDQGFLDMFSFGWEAGNHSDALTQPRSVVLTKTTARRLFSGSPAIGMTVQLGEMGDFLITGILPDPPKRSHIRFDYLISYPTLQSMSAEELSKLGINGFDEIWRGLTYVLLTEKGSRAMLDQTLASQTASYSVRSEKMHYIFQSQALVDVMPSRDLANEIGVGTPHVVLYFLMALGLVILLAACFNYVSLSLARSIKRAKEIGVRKVFGAAKKDVVRQFLTEAVLISLLAFVLAVGFLELLIPAFYNLDPFVSTIFQLERSFSNYLIFLLMSLLVGLAAGVFPALHIAGFQPLQAIQQLKNVRLFSRMGLRKTLVTLQLTLSLVFILVVIIVLKQQNHVLNADLGQNIENIVSVQLQGLSFDKFSQRAMQIKGVESVSSTSVAILAGENNEETAIFGERNDSMQVGQSFISQNFLQNMSIPLVAGVNFPEDNYSEGEQFAIVNETATRQMGFPKPDAALGSSIVVSGVPLSIIGVTKDFHHDNIWFSPIKPFVLRNKSERAYNAYLRLSEANQRETLASLHAIWSELSPQKNWYGFYLEERVYNMAKFFRMGSSIIGFVGFLTIVIACLGLLGMVVYVVEGSVKEVGIRKVLGAGEARLVWQLSKGFLLLMCIAVFIAVPLTVFAADMWLNNFLMRISVEVEMVALGISIVLFLGLLTVMSQTYWAARANPIEAIKNE